MQPRDNAPITSPRVFTASMTVPDDANEATQRALVMATRLQVAEQLIGALAAGPPLILHLGGGVEQGEGGKVYRLNVSVQDARPWLAAVKQALEGELRPLIATRPKDQGWEDALLLALAKIAALALPLPNAT